MNIQTLSLNLICYGNGNTFSLDQFKPPSYNSHFKPRGGLWTSPIDSPHGWKQWCEDASFGDLTSSFTLHYSGVTAVIDSYADMIALPKAKDFWIADEFFYRIDIAELLTIGVDAIHLTTKGEHLTRWSEPGLYGWDCETVYVLNPKSVKEVDKG